MLPGIAVVGFSLSPDGKRVIYDSRDENGKHRLWLASLDHRFTPRQIDSGAGQSWPVYAPSGRIYFRVTERDVAYLYRMSEDGAQREKILAEPITWLYSVSPDERFVVVGRIIKEEDSPTAVEAVPLNGGPAVRICSAGCDIDWTRDGKALYFSLRSVKGRSQWRTYVIPLPHGAGLLRFPAKGVQSDADLPNRAALQVLEEFISPGPNSSLYCFGKKSSHWNLYRIPVP